MVASVSGISVSEVLASKCGTITIDQGSATPGSGTTSTNFLFSVHVIDTSGKAPAWVRVRFPNGSYKDLTASGSDYAAGVIFSGARQLPVGTWSYTFTIPMKNGKTCSAPGNPSVVTVTALPSPTPKPTPSPKPTPRPTPPPTPKPAPTPAPRPTPRPTPARTATPTSTPALLQASPSGTAVASPSRTTDPTSGPNATAAIVAVLPAGGGGPGAPGGGSGGSESSGLDDRFDAGPGSAGFGSLFPPTPLFAWGTTTAAGILLFLFLVRRRSGDEERSLATFVFEFAGAGAPPAIDPVAIEPLVLAPVHPAAKPTKKRGTTKRDNLEVAPEGAPLASTAGPREFRKPPAKGVERVFVSYQGVPLGTTADELRSEELARLQRGDEVEIIASQGGYLNVRLPTGETGWIPRGTVTGTRPGVAGGEKASHH